jgi:hypothetical protein
MKRHDGLEPWALPTPRVRSTRLSHVSPIITTSQIGNEPDSALVLLLLDPYWTHSWTQIEAGDCDDQLGTNGTPVLAQLHPRRRVRDGFGIHSFNTCHPASRCFHSVSVNRPLIGGSVCFLGACGGLTSAIFICSSGKTRSRCTGGRSVGASHSPYSLGDRMMGWRM